MDPPTTPAQTTPAETTPAQTRKRTPQPDPPAQIAEPRPEKKARHDTEAITRVSRTGSPDLSDWNIVPRHNEMPSEHGSSGKKSTTGDGQKTEQPDKRLTAHDSSFEGHLVEHGLFSVRYPHADWRAAQPSNLEEWKQALLETRASLSPEHFTEQHFREYYNAVFQASNDREIMGDPFSTVAGETNIRHAMERSFDQMDPITDGSIVPPKPNAFAGAAPSTIDEKVWAELAHLIVPFSGPTNPVVPNFFVEAKARRGNSDVALHQACHDGAVGARSIQSVQSFGKELPVFDHKAYSISVAFDGQLLRIFCSHPVPSTSSDASTFYHMHQLGAYAMTHDRETFVAGASAFRNAFELAEKYRTQFIEQANEKARGVSSQNLSSASAEPRSTSRAKRSTTSTANNSQVNTSFEETGTQNPSTATTVRTSEGRATRPKAREIKIEAREIKSEAREIESEAREIKSEAREIESEAREIKSEARDVKSEENESDEPPTERRMVYISAFNFQSTAQGHNPIFLRWRC